MRMSWIHRRILLPGVLGMALSLVLLPVGAPQAQDAEVPKSVRADILTLQAEQALKKKDHEAVLKAVQEIRDLRQPVPAALLFIEAKSADAAGDPVRAVSALTAYFNAVARDDEHYREAVALMPQLEAKAADARRREEARRAEASGGELDKAVAATLQSLEESLVAIPAGSYRMGDVNHTGGDLERPAHRVNVPAFRLMKYEVTFEQYDAFAQMTGRTLPEDWGWGRGKRPVINTSWRDATAMAKWLSEKTGKRWRLPTEAEWEYAARAGTTTDYPWGNKFEKNRVNNGPTTDPVGSYAANAWGLHDMHGNAWEWMQDCWTPHYKGAPADGSAWTAGDCSSRVVRGGSWYYDASWLRSPYRGKVGAASRTVNIGFRLARDE